MMYHRFLQFQGFFWQTSAMKKDRSHLTPWNPDLSNVTWNVDKHLLCQRLISNKIWLNEWERRGSEFTHIAPCSCYFSYLWSYKTSLAEITCSILTTSVLSSTSLVAQLVKHLPTMWETWVRSLGWEDPLEKEMATHSSTLAWKIP